MAGRGVRVGKRSSQLTEYKRRAESTISRNIPKGGDRHGGDVARTSPAHAEDGGRRHAGVCSVLRSDNAGADRPSGARYTAADAVCAEGLRAGDGGSRGGAEDLRSGDLWDGRRAQERVIADEFRRQMGGFNPLASCPTTHVQVTTSCDAVAWGRR